MGKNMEAFYELMTAPTTKVNYFKYYYFPLSKGQLFFPLT